MLGSHAATFFGIRIAIGEATANQVSMVLDFQSVSRLIRKSG